MSNDEAVKLRVWHIPQVPMKAFYVAVATPAEAIKILDVLASYDAFQYDNRVKGDYANAQGLQALEDGEWLDWYDDETGMDIREWSEAREG